MLIIGFSNEVEKHTMDEPVSVLVTVIPALSVVITVRQGIVVLVVPNVSITPVIVKLLPTESEVVISVVARGLELEVVIDVVSGEPMIVNGAD